MIEGTERGEANGPGEKSRRLKNFFSVGVAGGSANFDGDAFPPLVGEADFVRRCRGVVGIGGHEVIASNCCVKSRRRFAVWLWLGGEAGESDDDCMLLWRDPGRVVLGVAAVELG